MNRSEKIESLAQTLARVGVVVNPHAMAQSILDELFPPLKPIERDEAFDRDYIPMLGDSEVQTKGKGSSFRIYCDDDRLPMAPVSYEQEFLTKMAHYIRKQYGE